MEVLWKYLREGLDLVVEIWGSDVLKDFPETETFKVWKSKRDGNRKDIKGSKRE